MFCPKCGTQNDDGRAVCAFCGAELETPNVAQTVAEQPVYDAQVQQAPVENPGKVFGIISLVLGILGLLCGCCYGSGIAFSIAGLILGIIGGKKSKAVGAKNVMGLVGAILSGVGIAVAVLWALYYVIYVVVLAGAGVAGSMY